MMLTDAVDVVELDGQDEAELLARPRCRAGCGRQADRHRAGPCGRCAKTPAVRARFPSVSKYGRVSPAARVGCGGRRLPDAPTSAAPGSPEKVAVLEERARLGVAFWHPLDAPMDPESRKLGVS